MQEAKTIIDVEKCDLTFMREGFVISEIRGVDNKLQISFYDIKDSKTLPFVVDFIGMFKKLNVPIIITNDAKMFLIHFKQEDILEGL